MTDVSRSGHGTLPLEVARRLDAICDRFEQAWQAAAAGASPPRLADYLADVAEAERPYLLRELIPLDIAYRRDHGEEPQAADYQQRFPSLVLPPVETGVSAAADAARASSAPVAVPGYEILQELGHGGMGVVYWAWQTGLNRNVALKMIRAGAHARPQELARFHTEAEAVARLQHPHIVQIYDVGQQGACPYMALEYVDGGSLARRLSGTPWPARAAAQLVETLARAIGYAHRQGIVHRDLTPGNVLLLADGTPKITDFGLAKVLVGGGPTLTESGAILGTPSYMAPEQAAGKVKEMGPACDVYALGAILYELLTGRPPHKAETPLETLQQVQGQEPVPPSRLQPKLPHDLVTICLKCLQKEPGKRYAAAEDLAEDLRRFLAGEPIHARPVSRTEKLWRWCRRKPLVAGLAGSVSLLLVVLAVGASITAWWLGQAGHRLRDQLGQTEQAESDRRNQLWRSYRDEARARRFGRQPGQSLVSLERLREAAQLVRSLNQSPEALQESLLELRAEAVACLALPDLREIRRWPGHFELTAEASFDTPLERYAQGDRQGDIHIRRVADDAEVLRLPGPGVLPTFVHCLFSPDGRYLAARYELDQPGPGLILWDLPARQRIFASSTSTPQWGFTFSPDGHWLAFSSDQDDRIRLIDCRQRREGKSLGRGLRASQLAFRPDGRQLAFTGKAFPVVGVVDVESGEMRAMLPDAGVFARVAWSPDGRLLAVGGSGKIQLWKFPERRRTAVLEEPQHEAQKLLFCATGALLASRSGSEGTTLWDPASGRQLLHTRGYFLNFGPRDARLAFGDRRDLGIWEVVKGGAVTTWHRAATTVDFSPDGRLLAAAGADGVGLWDVQAARAVADLRLDRCETAAFQPHGHHLVTDGKTSGLQLWPLRSGPPEAPPVLHVGPPQVVPLEFPQHAWQRACWSRDGQWLAAVNERSWGNRALLLNAQRPTEVRTLGAVPQLATIAISADGQWVAGGTWNHHCVRVWQAADPKVFHDLPNYGNAAFSPDDQWLVTSGPDDYCCWRVGSWEQPVRRWRRGESAHQVTPLAFAPGGDLLALILRPQEIDLVDPGSEQVLARLATPAPAMITGLCFSPDGQRLAAAKANREVDLWDLRFIRRELANLGLDWDRPPFPPLAALGKDPPLQIHVVEATAKHPTPAWRVYWRLRGEGDRLRRAWTEAAIDFTDALAILPADAPAHDRAELLQRRAESYAHLQAHDAARDDWEQVVALEPDNAAACHDLARLYVIGPTRLRDPAKALALARNAVELAPKRTAYRSTLGMAYYRTGRYALGVATLEQGMNARQGETAAEDLLVLAMCYARLGQASRARDCYDRAVRWMQERQGQLSAKAREELKGFHAEADQVLSPPGQR
jgi:serine/threonine protein kinase/WD40 repeat protein/Tfp pilus assembly protein PilF